MKAHVHTLDERELDEALAGASIPVLLSALYQLTGDERWLNAPYSPEAPKGFDDPISGGLPEELQAEVRAAARDAAIAWAAGDTPAVPEPDDALLARIMSAGLGTRVPESYGPMIAEQLGFRSFAPEPAGELIRAAGREFHVLVIGAGVSGLVAARGLQAAGIDYTVVEKNLEVGGTWWENRYPGARVDVPSNLYSFSFRPKAWTEVFSQRDEIADYMIATSHELGVRDHVKFGYEVTSLAWDEDAAVWQAELIGPNGDRSEIAAHAVITAVGIHNRPKIPDITGLSEFSGEVIHSGHWPNGVSLDGKKVAVVGTGASAMQIVAAVVDQVEHLSVFQRSAHWIAPNADYFEPITGATNWLLEHMPFYWEWYRFRVYWIYTESMHPALVVDPDWDLGKNSVSRFNDALRRFYTSYLESELAGHEDLIEKCLPTFPVFGRRILMDNGWFRALRRDDVALITDKIAKVTPDGIHTAAGEHVELDTIVLCTGFQQQRFLYPLEVTGEQGRSLRDEWHDDDARAYLGIVTPGYPNLFYMFGPNTNPPGGSFINLAEAQARYIVTLIATMAREGIAAVDCRQDVYEKYNAEVDAANAGLVYGFDGLESYYRNASGRVVTNSPWKVLDYWRMTEQPQLSDYRVYYPSAMKDDC